jgi:hypothetical protein
MGTGGSRFGAGRPGWKAKAELCQALDIRKWHRGGYLRPGYFGGWRWTSSYSGETTASIGFSVSASAVELRYSSNGQGRTQQVRLNRTQCHLGGSRPWFTCPVRGERVAILYFRAGRFACRHCQRVAYQSQSEDATGRAWLRQGKAEARLGPEGERPKGMHQATYERLWRVIDECEEIKDFALALMLSRFGLSSFVN